MSYVRSPLVASALAALAREAEDNADSGGPAAQEGAGAFEPLDASEPAAKPHPAA